MLLNAVSLSYLSDIKMNTGQITGLLPVRTGMPKNRTFRSNTGRLATLGIEVIKHGADYSINADYRVSS